MTEPAAGGLGARAPSSPDPAAPGLTVAEVEDQLRRHQEKELLRLVVVGSVDDGKSTLIGRLLHDTNGVYDDQLSAVKRASTQAGMEIDFSLFTDGLKAEREQGITIDVAYRYFATENRKFIIADTPGHIQYTRNMATGASTANVGLILIDARLGVLTQSRRHAYIASLLGIPHLAVAVNKMDLVGFRREVYERITEEFSRFAAQLDFKDVSFVPVSALQGDNIVERSARIPWYSGPSILGLLETVPIAADRNLEDFRYPVQYVIRPHLDYRGFAGEIASGRISKGDPILVLPSRQRTRVASIDTYEGSIESATAPLSVTLTLEDEVDVSRGDMLVRPDSLPNVAGRFEATLVWMHQKPLDREKSYLLKQTTRLERVEVEQIVSRTNLDTLLPEPCETLELNDIGTVRVRSNRPLYFDSYRENRRTGAFILIDSLGNGTVAAGVILAPSGGTARREGELGQHSMVSPRERQERLGQRGSVVLLTGLPGSGKTEVAYAAERLLYDRGHVALVVDAADRPVAAAKAPAEQAQPAEAVLELCRRAADAGLIVLLSFAAPSAAGRSLGQTALGAERWLEVALRAPLERRRSAAPDFYGRHPEPEYESPANPAANVDLGALSSEAAARVIVDLLEQRGVFSNR
jgi:bifunctional enzyme CysN/CysC